MARRRPVRRRRSRRRSWGAHEMILGTLIVLGLFAMKLFILALH